jgi:hypothetical protein
VDRREVELFKARSMTAGLEARGGIEPPIKVLQTFALPLGDRASEEALFYQRVATTQTKLNRNLALPFHQSKIGPNSICREVVKVEVMTPAVAEGSTIVAEVKTNGFGLLKLLRRAQ